MAGKNQDRAPIKIGSTTLVVLCVFGLLHTGIALAASTLPGTDAVQKFTAAGTLLKLIDSFLFKFGARLMAGLAILGAGWNLKEQRFALAVVCIIGAIVMGTAPMWVKNIFAMADGGGGSIFNNIK